MALLEYATLTVPDVVKKSVISFYNRDPLLKALQSRMQVKRSGGTQVRVVRVKSGHSDVTEINETNLSVPLAKRETLSAMTGDWAKYIKPVILPHIDRDRMSSKEEVKRFVQDESNAAMQALRNDVVRQMYLGSVTNLAGLATMNGSRTGGTSSGFANGALSFRTPAEQATDALTYLNETRVNDTTNFVDNWYNQFESYTSGVDFLQGAERLKITADTYAEDEEGISIGILGIADHVSLGDEVRTTGATSGPQLMYTVADINSGKANPTVHIVNGVQYHANRWMTATTVTTTGGAAVGNPVYLFNPNTVEYWVNANNDFRVTKFTDHLETSNVDADVGYIILEVQLAVTNLMSNGCMAAASILHSAS
jgi:hypothetical protein